MDGGIIPLEYCLPENRVQLLVQPIEPIGHFRVQRVMFRIHLMPTRGFESDRQIPEFLPKFKQSKPSFFNPVEHGIGTLIGQVGKQFTRTPETGKPGILHTCTTRERPAFQDEHMMVGKSAFMEQGGKEAHNASPYNHKVRLPMELVGFPYTFHCWIPLWSWCSEGLSKML